MQKPVKIIILLALVLTFAVTNLQFGGDKKAAVKVNIKERVPFVISGYQGEEGEIPEKVYKFISPEEIMIRSYKKDDKLINLAIVVADDKEDLHAPEVCYKLQGFKFLTEEDYSLSSGCRISKINTVREEEPYIFYIYYTDMKEVYKNRFEFMKNLIIHKLLNKSGKKYALVIAFTERSNQEDLQNYSQELYKYILD